VFESPRAHHSNQALAAEGQAARVQDRTITADLLQEATGVGGAVRHRIDGMTEGKAGIADHPRRARRAEAGGLSTMRRAKRYTTAMLKRCGYFCAGAPGGFLKRLADFFVPPFQ